MAITYAQMCDAVEAYLAANCPSLVRSQSYDELTEGIHDEPLQQVYPESGDIVSTDSGTQTHTFRGGVVQSVHIIHVDYYARQRSHIGEDMAALVDGVDEIYTALEAAGCPPFGLDGIKNFQWSWQRVAFEYGGVFYMGARFTLRLRVF